MKKIILVCLLFKITSLAAQTDSSEIILLNQQVDNGVVKNDTNGIRNLYAADFVFSHGSGKVEGRESWLQSVAKGNFLLRRHDSVTVELHPGLAIVRGKLSVQKKNGDKTDRYYLRYVRVYAKREKQWQMLSHYTYYEYHEPVQ